MGGRKESVGREIEIIGRVVEEGGGRGGGEGGGGGWWSGGILNILYIFKRGIEK